MKVQWNHTPQQYINEFPKWLDKYSNKVVNTLTKSILQVKPEITNPYLVQAILWTLSSEHVTYANYWLSGLELSQAQAEFMGLPNHNNEDREANALSNVRQILDIISNYKIPVICFDELDTTEVADNGFTAPQIIASLAKDLFNSLKKGVLLLSMYRSTWNEHIRALPQSEAVIDRLVSDKSDRQPIFLNKLNSDDVIAVVQHWLQEFYQVNQQIPPHYLYPFDEQKLRDFGKSKPTVRSLLKWCAENFVLQEKHPVEPYFQQELANVEADIDNLFEDNVSVSNALWLGFESLVGETLEGVKIELVEEVNANPFYIVRIIGNKGKVKIGVGVIQQSAGVGVAAGLGKLINYKHFDLTRGCLVRSKKISAGAAVARKHLSTLLHELGGEWVGLRKEDIKPLLAILLVYYESENYELTDEQIFEFIKQNKLAINNPLIREILSDPSGQEPDYLTDDDLPMRTPKNIENLAEDINNISLTH
jgi:hypothetical protein